MKCFCKKLGEIADITMGTSPKGHTYNSLGEGLPLLNGPTEFGDKYPVCTSFTTASVRECLPGDIIFCVRGSTTGRMNWADKVYSLGRGVCSIRGEKESDTSFINYCLKHTLPALLQFAGGTTFPNLSRDAIQGFSIPFPDNRSKIAAILSNYDDLIENNQRRIKLLEESARLLYREWFVYFRFPGHEHVKIKQGIPAGWTTGVLSDFYDTTSGGTPSRTKPEYFDGDINWVKTQELNDCFIFETQEKITDEAVRNSSAKVFPENTVLVSIYGGTNIGRTGLLSTPAASNQACVALFPIHKCSNYMHASLFFREIRQILIGLAQGAAQTNINQNTIRSLPMVMPPKVLMDIFEGHLFPVFQQIKNLQLENIHLAKARDILLPKLMNGEVSV